MDIGALWHAAVVEPLTQALVALYGLLAGLGLPSLGLTIIVFTVIVRLLTFPLTLQQIRSAKAMQALQPQLKALQKQYGKDRERLMQEQMRLYREHRVNPAAGCLPLLIQMPIWIGLYSALYNLTHQADGFVMQFLWLNLSQPEHVSLWPPAIPILTLLMGATQFLYQRMVTPPAMDEQQRMMNQMMLFMPLMFIYFAFTVPSGLVLYWLVSNLISIAQQYALTRWNLFTVTPVAAASPAAAAETGTATTTPSTPPTVASDQPARPAAETPRPAGPRPLAAHRRKKGKRR